MRIMIVKEIKGVLDLSALMLTTFYIEVLNGGFQNGVSKTKVFMKCSIYIVRLRNVLIDLFVCKTLKL